MTEEKTLEKIKADLLYRLEGFDIRMQKKQEQLAIVPEGKGGKKERNFILGELEGLRQGRQEIGKIIRLYFT